MFGDRSPPLTIVQKGSLTINVEDKVNCKIDK